MNMISVAEFPVTLSRENELPSGSSSVNAGAAAPNVIIFDVALAIPYLTVVAFPGRGFRV